MLGQKICFLMLKVNKIGFQEALRKKYDFGAIFWRKKAVFDGARDAKMRFSFGRGAIFGKIRLSMLGLQKQSSGGRK